MNKVLIVSDREWGHLVYNRLIESGFVAKYKLCRFRDELECMVSEFEPTIIFFPFWSSKIPDKIFSSYKCVMFHMTDLPYGRGGSPLQNLIKRGHTTTMLSCLKVAEEVDSGEVYLKRPLELSGSAKEIYYRAADTIVSIVLELLRDGLPKPHRQQGDVVMFNRRTPEQSLISADMSVSEIYDFIRMLDAPGYPKAFLDLGDSVRLEFSSVQFEKNDRSIVAEVRIFQHSE